MHVIVVSMALPVLTDWHCGLVYSCSGGTQIEVICALIWFLPQRFLKLRNHERKH
jgi:hypothetical protein